MIPANPYDEPELPLVSIGAAAQVLGISINLLRFYEAEGLILPARTDKNQRRYSRADLARVQCIRHAIQEEGMTIAAHDGDDPVLGNQAVLRPRSETL